MREDIIKICEAYNSIVNRDEGMTMTKPTIRVFNHILGKQLRGWNDKRKNRNRVKFSERLTDKDKQKLRDGLNERYGTSYSFIIKDHEWVSPLFDGSRVVTVVEYFPNEL